MRLLVWLVATLLALIWTGGAALLALLVQLAAQGVAASAEVSLPAAAGLALPAWLASWIDPAWWQAALQSASSAWAAASAWAPALSTAVGWFEPAIRGAWAVGIVALLALAGLSTWLVGRVARHGPGSGHRGLAAAPPRDRAADARASGRGGGNGSDLFLLKPSAGQPAAACSTRRTSG